MKISVQNSKAPGEFDGFVLDRDMYSEINQRARAGGITDGEWLKAALVGVLRGAGYETQNSGEKCEPLPVTAEDGTPKEYKVVALRECAPQTIDLDTPNRVADYWRQAVVSHPFFNPDAECLVAVMVNTQRRVIGHSLVSVGTLDTCLGHAREVFRSSIVVAASAVVLVHNHPSGSTTPSAADITITRELIRAGRLLKIDLLDHVIVGQREKPEDKGYSSLRELGYFYS